MESTAVENCVVSQGRILGIVLDVSLRHHEGRRILDSVKECLVNFVRETLQAEDIFYLYHPEIIETVEDVGVIVSAIGNYETDGWLIDLRHALEQTSYVMAAEDEDYERIFLYVTDRVQKNNDLKRILSFEKRDQTGCGFLFIGIGNQYNRDILSLLEEENECVTYSHLDDPRDLYSILMG